MDCFAVLKKIDDLYPEYLDIWAQICAIESPTGCKAGVDAVGQYCAGLARQRGWQVEIDLQETAGNALCITMNPDAQGAPVTFSGHMDTVHPVGAFGETPVHRDEDYIYGPGVIDCKGGIAASLLAMDALEQCGFHSRPVQLLLQSDEETGSRNSGLKTVEYLCRKAANSAAFLNTEPHEHGTAVVQRKGILRYRFTVTGKAVHSSICYQGANAVAEAAHKLLKLEAWKDRDGLTCNCSVISGGTASNSVADHCVFEADIRFATQAQYEMATQFVQTVAEESTIPGCSCRAERLSYRPPMERSEQNLALLEKLNGIYAANDLPVLTPRATPGGSDAAYTTLAGIPTVDSLGVVGSGMHSIREMGRLTALADSAKRLAAAAACL